jgi:hypothetical protein
VTIRPTRIVNLVSRNERHFMRTLRRFLARLLPTRLPGEPAEFTRSPEARTALDPIAELATTREQILTRVRMLHPEPNCLPVPELHIPEHDGQLPVIEHYAIGLGANLLTQDCRTSPQWKAACRECEHAPDCIIEEIYGLLWQWYRLVLAADRLVIVGGKRAAREFAWHLWNVRGFLAGMPTRYYPPSEIGDTTVAELREGAEFSLDGGMTWHVLAMYDYILRDPIVYTGEHDENGQPRTAYLWYVGNRPCLTHIVPDWARDKAVTSELEVRA